MRHEAPPRCRPAFVGSGVEPNLCLYGKSFTHFCQAISKHLSSESYYSSPCISIQSLMLIANRIARLRSIQKHITYTIVTMPPIPKTPIKLAILDDYQNIASPHFETLKPNFSITVFRDTLLPYNHPSTPQDVKQEIIERLKPFTVISSMRERTPFPRDLLKQLPNLKLLLTTGLRNAAIDMVAAKEFGIHVTGAPGKGRSTSAAAKKKRGPDSTTQHCVALILGIARGLASDDKEVKTGGWETGLATGLSGKNYPRPRETRWQCSENHVPEFWDANPGLEHESYAGGC